MYTNCRLDMQIEHEHVYNRMEYLLERFECGANAFYEMYRENEQFVSRQEIKYMSRITQNVLKSFDYKRIKSARNTNFQLLAKAFNDTNKLKLIIPEAPYMYPLLVDKDSVICAGLNERKIYTPLLWPNIIDNAEKSDFAYYLADNILPLPCDQRYSCEDMTYIIKTVKDLVKSN